MWLEGVGNLLEKDRLCWKKKQLLFSIDFRHFNPFSNKKSVIPTKKPLFQRKKHLLESLSNCLLVFCVYLLECWKNFRDIRLSKEKK